MVRISIMVVRALVAAVERAGIERARFLAEAGLEHVQFDDMQGRIPLEDYRRAADAAYELSQDAAFGLHMGERLATGSFDVLGHLSEHSGCLREALQCTMRYCRIVSEGPRLELDEHADRAELRLLLPDDDTRLTLLAAEFAALGMLRLIRSFVGEDAVPESVLFTHPKPEHHAEYTRIFHGRQRFSQAFTGFELERSWLDRRPSYEGRELHAHLLSRAELLLARADREVSTAERVKRWLACQPDLVRPMLGLVARDLGMSTRSLRRHLQAEQLQFNVLVSEARAAHAKRALLDPERTIQDTAFAIGFRTPSAFSRAFKRWTGVTPKAYRDAHCKDSAPAARDMSLATASMGFGPERC